MNQDSRRLLKIAALAALSWMLLVGASLYWGFRQADQQAFDLASNTAHSSFDKDQAYRFWASRHGGVYVPPDERTPPSPWMSHIPDRDVLTTDGKQLTLMNPAYMLRQMMDEFGEMYGVKGRIVGLVALNPNNIADPWEASGIRAFEKGSREVVEVSQIEGKPYLRLLRPMMMEESCQKCHGHLGFANGQIRGAVGVAVPLEPFFVSARQQKVLMSVTHGVIWLFGMAVLCFVAWRAMLAARERQRYLDEIELAARVFEDGLEGVLITDASGVIQRVNPAFTAITGYSAEDAVGARPNIMRSGRHDQAFYENLWAALREHGRWEGELWNRRRSGEVFVALETISAVKGAHGQVAHYVGVFRDVTERIHTEERLRYLAHYDALTGLPNRALLIEHLEQAIVRSRRERESLSVFFVDLDYFKAVNDSMGHAAGDELLRIVATRLKGCLRESDTVARLSGDEFVVMMEKCGQHADMERLLNKLVESLLMPVQLSGRSVTIGVSIGAAVFPGDGEDAEALLRSADTAMYRAKERGRGRYEFFRSELAEQADDRFTVIAEFREAIERGDFRLFYQVQIDACSGRVSGAEALVRWLHRDKGMIPPDRFIPLAEQTGLIVQLGDWVLREACRQAAAWRRTGIFDGARVSVNVSGVQVARGGLVAKVKNALTESGLPPEALELEVTEGVMVEGLREGFAELSEIKALGVSIAIDDFGTGYSSLAALKFLPISRLKIDRSFVRALPDAVDDLAIAQMIVRMAETLRLEVTAEGVETEAQADCLRATGCHELQGYLFSRPLPVDEMAETLRQGRVGKPEASHA